MSSHCSRQRFPRPESYGDLLTLRFKWISNGSEKVTTRVCARESLKTSYVAFFHFIPKGHVTQARLSGGGENLNYTCIHSTTATFKVTTFLVLKACAGVTFISFYQYGRQYYKEVKLPYEKKKRKEKSSEPSIYRALF